MPGEINGKPMDKNPEDGRGALLSRLRKTNLGDHDFSLLSREISFGPSFLFASICLLFSFLAFVYLPDQIWFFDKTSLIGYTLFSIIRYSFVFLLPVLFFSKYYRIPDHLLLGENPGLGAFLLSALSGIPFAAIIIAISNLQTYFLVINRISLPEAVFLYRPVQEGSGEMIALSVIATILIPVLAEELLFRGFFFAALQGGKRDFVVVLLSALLFTAFSLDTVWIIPTFLTGLLLAFIRRSTGNVFCSMIARVSMLLFTFLVKDFLPLLDIRTIRGKADFDMTFVYTSIVVVVVCIVGFLPVISQLFQFGRDRLEVVSEAQGQESSKSLLSAIGGIPFFIGMLVVICTWILLLGV